MYAQWSPLIIITVVFDRCVSTGDGVQNGVRRSNWQINELERRISEDFTGRQMSIQCVSSRLWRHKVFKLRIIPWWIFLKIILCGTNRTVKATFGRFFFTCIDFDYTQKITRHFRSFYYYYCRYDFRDEMAVGPRIRSRPFRHRTSGFPFVCTVGII